MIIAISGKAVMKTGKGQEGGFLPLLVLPLMIYIVLGKGVRRAKRGYSNMDKSF